MASVYMNIRSYRVPAAQIDEVVRRVDDNWLDRAAKLHGFISYYVVRSGPEELTSMAVFQDEATADAASEASAEWVGERLFDLDVKLTERERGPVLVHGGA